MEIINEINIEIKEILDKHEISISKIQKDMLDNHINEMIKRNTNKEKVPEIDDELFEQISNEALKCSQKIVDKFEYLGKDEIFLLAIHFENMIGVE